MPGFLDRRAADLERFVRALLSPDRAFARVEGSLVAEADRMDNAADVQAWLAHWLRNHVREDPGDEPARAGEGAEGRAPFDV